MSAGLAPSRFDRIATGVLIAFLLLAPDAAWATRAWLADLGDLNPTQRLWLAAFGGLSLGLAFGLIVFELRSRGVAIALRRLTGLAAGLDGREAEETRRAGVSVELARLSDEVLYSAQRMARERRETGARLSDWDAIFAAALDGMFALDANGCITQVNPAAERLLRIEAQNVIGKPLVDVMLPPSHRSPDNAMFARDLASGKAQGRRQELVAQRGDGRQFPLEVAIAEFGSGERRGFVVTARDISSQRRMRADLSRANERIERELPPLHAEVAQLRQILAQLAGVASANAPNAGAAVTPQRRAFTVESACGELIRKLVSRAERKGLGFRFEDTEVQGLSLIGEAARLRRVLVNLIDSVVRVTDAGEIVVHITALPGEGRQVDLAASVVATRMSDEQAARLMRPFINDQLARRDPSPYPAGPNATRQIDFLGTRIVAERIDEGGSMFRFGLRFEADLSQIAIDVSAPVNGARAPATGQVEFDERARAVADFVRAAARLRRNAERANLGALWAEAHRLRTPWQRHGDPAHAGLVSALAHTARGGDASNAIMLARRLADALEQLSQRDYPVAAA